jgi:hypothetical protein
VNGNADGVVVGRGTGGTRLTAAQSVVQASYSGWDFTNTWAIDAGSTTPYLQGLPKPASVKANVLTPTQQNNVQNAVSNSLSSSTNTIMYKNAFDRGTFTQPSDARNTFNTAMSQAIGLSTRLLATDECGPGGAGCSSSSVRPSDQ